MYSTAVSSEALNNAMALNKEIVIIPNMIEINKDIRYEDNGNFLFIGALDASKTLAEGDIFRINATNLSIELK